MLQTLGADRARCVAGTFLILIGLTQPVRRGGHRKGVPPACAPASSTSAELERQLQNRGFPARLLGRVMRRVEQAVAPVPGRAA